MSDRNGKFKADFKADFKEQLHRILIRLEDVWFNAVSLFKEKLLPSFLEFFSSLSRLSGRQRQLGQPEADQPADYSEYQDSDGPTEFSLSRNSSVASQQAVPPPPPHVPRPYAEPGMALSPLADSHTSQETQFEAPEQMQIESEPTAFIDRADLASVQAPRDDGATAILRLPKDRFTAAESEGQSGNIPAESIAIEQSSYGGKALQSNFNDHSEQAFAGDNSRNVKMSSLYASIWTYDGAIAEIQPHLLNRILQDFQADGQSVAEMFQGHYERNSALSFSIHWEVDGDTSTNSNDTFEAQLALTLRAALMIRQNFMQWNLTRSRSGLVPLTMVMGADFTDGFVCESNGMTFVGEAALRARALSQLSMSLGTDLLVAETIWNVLNKHFVGERLAQAQLTASGYRTSVYKVLGYWNDQGQKIFVSGIESSMQDIPMMARQVDAPKIELTAQDRLWTVNNGNQIIGPIHPRDIAKLLYAQELDFDCECWEADGNRLSIAKSGMFGVSEDSEAKFWIFDGETIHGPLTEGFVRTGVLRKIFKKEAYLCESNTILGWKQLGAWMEPKGVVLEVPPANSESAPAATGLENISPPTFEFPERSPQVTLGDPDDAQIEIVDIERVDDAA